MVGLLGGVGQSEKGCGDSSHSQRAVIVGRLEDLADSGGLNRQTVEAAYNADSICSEEADYFYNRIG